MNRTKSTFGPSLTLLLSASMSLWCQEPANPAVQKAESTWLALVDKGAYDASWKTAATSFRTALTEAQWEQALKSVRTPLGRVISRKPQSTTVTKTLPGVPDGSYVIATFQTVFENKAAATETVTALLDKDGTWYVAGYFIR